MFEIPEPISTIFGNSTPDIVDTPVTSFSSTAYTESDATWWKRKLGIQLL